MSLGVPLFCNQTTFMSMISGQVPNDVGSYELCPIHNGAKYCLAFSDGTGRPNIVGMCVPSSCTDESLVRHIMNSTMNMSFHYTSATVPTDQMFCTETRTPSAGVWVALGIALLVVAVVIWATIYDYFSRLSELTSQFSLVRRDSEGAVTHVMQAPSANSRIGRAGSPGSSSIRRAASDAGIVDNASFGSNQLSARSMPTVNSAPSQQNENTRLISVGDEEEDVKDKARGIDFRTIMVKLSLAMSVIQSFRKWRYYPRTEAHLNIFNSLRTICWAWIVVTDTFTFTEHVPTYSTPLDQDSNPFYAFLQRSNAAAFAIGTFLFISGFTTTHKLNVEDETHERSNEVKISTMMSVSDYEAAGVGSTMCAGGPGTWGASLKWYFKRLFKRWMRLTPLYAAVIFLTESFFLHAGNGPFWSTFTDSATLHHNCISRWYTNLLYINNFVPVESDERCFPWSYYLALDFQFFALAPVLHWLFKKTSTKTFSMVMALMMVLSVLARYLQQAVSQSDGEAGTNRVTPQVAPTVSWLFEQPHLMVVPFLAGNIAYHIYNAVNSVYEHAKLLPQVPVSALTAEDSSRAPAVFLYTRLRQKRVRIAAIWSGILLWGVLIFGSWGFIRVPNNNHGRMVFDSLSIPVWSFALMLTTVPMLFGFGGVIQRFLTHRLWCGVSRLVFAAYLLDPVVVSFYNATQVTPTTMQVLPFMYSVWGHSIVTLLLAFCFHLGIEQPCIHLFQ